ncbi:unnamed protein product [Meloidogyne enterolobii]|uniref:Uncharacterized protein n=1 Tax=Meloidogyne enterolobii TaxID=390850 RepID=A0ACB0Z495_MELEN
MPKTTGPCVLKHRLEYLLPFNLSLNMPQAKLSEIEEKRLAEHSVQRLIDDGKGKRGVAKNHT